MNKIIPFFFAALLACGVSCDEPMPSRNDPGGVLTATLDARYYIKIMPHYQMNCMRIRVVLRNVYDKTLQDKAIFKNAFKITLPRERMIQKSFQLTPDMLKEYWLYDRASGLVTMNPGDTATFTYDWYFIDDQGIDLRNSVFQLQSDRTCPGRIIARREEFLVGGSFRLFQTAGTELLFTQRLVDVCWMNYYDVECPPAVTECGPITIVTNIFD
ncbi:MAG: hypothetical protein V1799_12040 [bacterium]